MVSVAVSAPEMFPLLVRAVVPRRHWYVNGPVPAPSVVKLEELPTQPICELGCVPTDGVAAGSEAKPLATTTSEYAPAGKPVGRRYSVLSTAAPVRTLVLLQLKVRA